MQYTLPVQQQQQQLAAAAAPTAPQQPPAAAAAAPASPSPPAEATAVQPPAAVQPAAAAAAAAPAGDPRLDKCGFAKLLGDNALEYYVKKYEIVLGRKSKAQVDVVLGDSPVLSRHHAKIIYNFEAKHWELVVEGKNGITVNGQLYTPMSPPCVLQSQDLLQAGDHNFYFLLPKQTRKRGPNKPKTLPAVLGDGTQQEQQQHSQFATPMLQQPQAPGLSTPAAAAAVGQQQQSPALPGVSPAAAAAAPLGGAGLRSSSSGPLLPGISPSGGSMQGGFLGNGSTGPLQPGGLGFGAPEAVGFGQSLPSLPNSSLLYGSGDLAPGVSGVLEELGQGDEMDVA